MSETHTEPPVPPATPSGPPPQQGTAPLPGTPPQPGPSSEHQHGTDGFFDSIRRTGLVRSQDRWVAGVAGGLARRFGVDPVVVRGLLAVSIVLGGIGLVLYGIAWLLLPEERDGRIHTQQLFRGDVNVAVLGAAGAIVVGLTVPSTIGPWGRSEQLGWFQGLTWLATVALIVVVVVMATRGRGTGHGPSTSLPRPAAAPPHPSGPVPPYAAAPAAYATPAPSPTTPQSAAAMPSTGGTMSTSGTLDDTSATAPAPAGGPSAPAPALGAPPAPSWAGPGATASGGGYGAGGGYGGYAGYGGWTPPPAGPTTVLPRTRPSGTGAILGVATALTLLTLAGLLYAHRTGYYDGPVGATTIAVGVGLLGVGIVVQALRGRTSGGLTALAIVGGLVAVPAVGVSTWDGDWSTGAGVGDVSATPTTVAGAESGLQVGAGSAVLDLTQVPLTGDDPVSVPVRVGAGELTVLLPADVPAEATVALGLGEVVWVDGTSTQGAGDGVTTYQTTSADDGRPVELVLDVQVGLGSVQFEER